MKCCDSHSESESSDYHCQWQLLPVVLSGQEYLQEVLMMVPCRIDPLAVLLSHDSKFIKRRLGVRLGVASRGGSRYNRP